MDQMMRSVTPGVQHDELGRLEVPGVPVERVPGLLRLLAAIDNPDESAW